MLLKVSYLDNITFALNIHVHKKDFYLRECNSQQESSLTVDSPTTSSIGGNHPLGLFPFQSTQSRRISPSTSPQLHHSVHDGKVKIEFIY